MFFLRHGEEAFAPQPCFVIVIAKGFVHGERLRNAGGRDHRILLGQQDAICRERAGPLFLDAEAGGNRPEAGLADDIENVDEHGALGNPAVPDHVHLAVAQIDRPTRRRYRQPVMPECPAIMPDRADDVGAMGMTAHHDDIAALEIWKGMQERQPDLGRHGLDAEHLVERMGTAPLRTRMVCFLQPRQERGGTGLGDSAKGLPDKGLVGHMDRGHCHRDEAPAGHRRA